MRRKLKFLVPGNIANDRDARAFVVVMVIIVLAIATVTYWPR